MPRRVIVELKNGMQVAGELIEERPRQSQQMIDGDKIRIIVSGPGIILNLGFANPVYYGEYEISRVHRVSFKSQLK